MRRSVIIVSGLLFITLLCGGLLAGVGSAQSAETETNASFGAEVSSFMQASEAEAEDELDDGMFDAALNRTTDPEERQALLEERQQRLEKRNRELQTRREALDGAANVRGHAIATRISVGANLLERSVNQTKRTATEVDMNTTKLETIRSNARELRGQEVSELARGFAGPPQDRQGPPEKADRGPPEKASNESRSSGNQSATEVSSGSLPPAPPINRPEGRDNRTGGPDGDASDSPGASDDTDRSPSAKPNGVGADGNYSASTKSSPGSDKLGLAEGNSSDSPGPPENNGETPPSEPNDEGNDNNADGPTKSLATRTDQRASIGKDRSD